MKELAKIIQKSINKEKLICDHRLVGTLRIVLILG